MANWEWIASSSVQKNLIVRKTASRVAGSYGPTYVADVEPPDETNTFEAVNLTAAERSALLTVMRTRGSTYTLTDNAGTSWSGRPVSFSTRRIKGCNLYEASLTLRSDYDEA